MEESTQPSVKSVSIKWGIISSLVGIIFFVLLDVADLSTSPIRWAGLIISFAIIALAHKAFKEEGDGHMSYGQGLGIGTLLSVVSAIITSAFTYLYISFINTEYISVIREKSIMDMESQGKSEAEIDQAMPFIEMFTSPTAMVIFGIIFGVFIGFVISLIVSIFTKKENPELI
jgi:uncharacterized membrane protein YedE/YeeE